ncbi:MAG: uracil-DNA glycosylase family protein [Gammaproteobacteria bacterium]|nr:uracil-DNA glycosylase family protein [Gammaproteobacteria bacterium]
MAKLLREVRACQICAEHLPNAPRPVLVAGKTARLLIIGQAPGRKVHATGIPWNDPSGNRLREWMGVGRNTFYTHPAIAIMPMGFCYPGTGKSGDLPPRKECAEQWHQRILQQLPNLQSILLIGQYAQKHYLDVKGQTLTDTVKQWRDYAPQYWPLPHPSPRNQRWLKKNPWYERELVPEFRKSVQAVLK